jgi:hypothetical protein
VVSVRAMCSILVLGFSVSKCVYSSGTGVVSFLISFHLRLCVFGTL